MDIAHRLKFRLAVLVFAACLCLPGIARSEIVTKEILLGKIADRNFSFTTPGGGTGTMRFSRNGTTRLSGANFEPSSDRGVWFYRGKSLCVRWARIENGKALCSPLKKIRRDRYRNAKGEEMWLK